MLVWQFYFYFYFISFLFFIFSRAAVSAVKLLCRPAHLLYLHSVIALSNFEQMKMDEWMDGLIVKSGGSSGMWSGVPLPREIFSLDF